MSTQNLKTSDYKTAMKAMDDFIVDASMDILKNIRFGVGSTNHSKMREIIRLKGILERLQKIENNEEKDRILSEVIRKSILLGNEL